MVTMVTGLRFTVQRCVQYNRHILRSGLHQVASPWVQESRHVARGEPPGLSPSRALRHPGFVTGAEVDRMCPFAHELLFLLLTMDLETFKTNTQVPGVEVHL